MSENTKVQHFLISKGESMSKTKEVQQFLDHIHMLVDYWGNQKVDKKGALEGLAFSFLTMLDGASGNGYYVIPDNKDVQEKNVFPPYLHELFHK